MSLKTRPASQVVINPGTGGLSILRDQLTLPTWLLVGATLQSLLFLLPVRRLFIAGPVLLLACYKLLQAVVAVSSYKPGQDDRLVSTPMTVKLDTDKDSTGGVCVLLLGLQINHPLGAFAPGVRDIVEYFREMAEDLEVNAEKYGYRGAKRYIASQDSTKNNEIMTLFYFSSHESLLKWAHDDVHMKGWHWWNKTVKNLTHVGLMHEMYDAPPGYWESTFVNYRPSGLGATHIPVRNEKDELLWEPALVAQTRAERTSLGRMGRSDGTDNEKRAVDPYSV